MNIHPAVFMWFHRSRFDGNNVTVIGRDAVTSIRHAFERSNVNHLTEKKPVIRSSLAAAPGPLIHFGQACHPSFHSFVALPNTTPEFKDDSRVVDPLTASVNRANGLSENTKSVTPVCCLCLRL